VKGALRPSNAKKVIYGRVKHGNGTKKLKKDNRKVKGRKK